jgi:hypothetical protein
VLSSLVTFGFDRPEDLGATFIAGAEDLARWTAGVPALDDDHPHRVSPAMVEVDVEPYLRFADLGLSRERFARSDFVRRVWPEGLRQRTLDAFAALGPVLAAGWMPYGVRPPGLGELHDLLAGTPARAGVQWIMGSDAFEERAARAARARGALDPEADEVLGIAAMADRDYPEAERLLARAQAHARGTGRLVAWRVLARCLSGDGEGAAALAASDEARPARGEPGFARMAAACGLPPPVSTTPAGTRPPTAR